MSASRRLSPSGQASCRPPEGSGALGVLGVWGVGFRVEDIGCKFRVEGLGFRVESLGFGAAGSGFWGRSQTFQMALIQENTLNIKGPAEI